MRTKFIFLGAIALFTLTSLPAFAGGGINFSMPQGFDPPVAALLGHGNSVNVTSGDLDPNQGGLEVHGRWTEVTQPSSCASSCQVNYLGITQITLQFQYCGPLKATATVPKGSPFKPWTVQTAYDKSTCTYTITYTAAPGSAKLHDWHDGSGQGFFGGLTASQGAGPLPITGAILVATTSDPTPLNTNPNLADSAAPAISSASVDKSTIWSPNGKPVNVNLTATVADANAQDLTHYISGVDPCSISVDVVRIDGTTSTDLGSAPVIACSRTVNADGSVTFNAMLALDAARNGFNVEGRIYLITLTAADKAGNTVSTSFQVTVTHDQSGP